MYPDATFFALLRDPIALYESHKRRKISKTPEQFARFYNGLVQRALRDKEALPNYHIVRFEDILSDPQGMIYELYKMAGLDPQKVTKVRFRAKPHYQANGTYGSTLPEFGHYWFDLERVYEILEPEINRLQSELISPGERDQVAELTRPVRETFGYA